MRRKRNLAPWCRKALEWSDLDLDGEAASQALAALLGKPAIYHCISRVVNRDHAFQKAEKEEFVAIMRRYAAFSQVQVLTFCVMSNHFHILVEIPEAPEDGGASWSDDRLLKELAHIYRGRKLNDLRWELGHYRQQGNEAAAEAFRQRFFRRMWDLSEYMKIVKQTFTQWFNRRHERRGVLWEERFKSELVEDGHAARRVGAYIDLNPVRAGMIKDPKDYRWSGYGEAVSGTRVAREGLRRVLLEEASTRMNDKRAAREVASVKKVLRDYRVVLFEEGREQPRDEAKNRAGISPERVKEVLAKGGTLSETEMGWCRTRYFVDGLVIGSESFVNHVFELTRDYFGAKRKTGARRMRGVASSLCTMRDLQKEPVTA